MEKPLADLSAHGKAAEVKFVDAKCRGEVKQIACEKLDRVRTGRDAGVAMAAGIETQKAESRLERLKLRLPHRGSRAEAIRKNNDGSRLWALQMIVENRSVNVNVRHG